MYSSKSSSVVGLSPITDAELEEYCEKGCSKQEALEEAAKDFLKLKLKLDSKEIEDLVIRKVTRPVKDGTERIYLHFSSEDALRYFFRKTAQVKNENVKVSQLFVR